MSAYPCLGITYLSWGLDEDGLLEVTAECNAGPDGNCGWHEDQTDELGITTAGFTELSKRHMEARAAVRDASQAIAPYADVTGTTTSAHPTPATEGPAEALTTSAPAPAMAALLSAGSVAGRIPQHQDDYWCTGCETWVPNEQPCQHLPHSAQSGGQSS